MDDVITLLIESRQLQDDLEAQRLRATVLERLQLDQRPTTIDRYVILDRVGSGGNSVVYSAYDPKLDRRVALKLIRQDGWLGKDREQARARWIREAQTMARMSHPNVLAVHDVATWWDETYIVLDLVDGVELGRWLERHHPPWREILRLFIEAGRGLAAAHAAGVVHRDFKPSNVLVTPGSVEGSFERVQVMDFGLATPPDRADSSRGRAHGSSGDKPRASDDSSWAQLTQPGTVMGTPAYMAPEQHRGEGVDAKADQFAFCVALYEGLFGLRPFTWKDLEEFEQKVRQGRMGTPGQDPRVPVRIKRILARGLAFESEDRWPSMNDLLNALGRDPRRLMTRAALGVGLVGIAGNGVALHLSRVDREARACEPGQRLGEVWGMARRNDTAASFGATQLPYAADTWQQVKSLVDGYVQQWSERYEASCRRLRADGEGDLELTHLEMACLEQRLWELDGLTRVLEGADREVVENAVRAASSLTPLSTCSQERLRREVALPPEASRAEVTALRVELARVEGLERAGLYGEAEPLADELMTWAIDLAYPPVHAEALLRRGSIRDLAGRYEAAERDLTDAIWLAEEHRLEEIAARATTRQVLVVGGHQRRRADGVAWARHAQAAVARLGATELLQAELLSNLGVMDRQFGDFAEARRKHAEALAIRERVLGAGHPAVAMSLKELGNAYYEWDDFEAALEQYQRALEIREQSLGPTHPAVAVLHNNIGNALNDSGRSVEARRHLEWALEIWEASLVSEHPSIAMGHHNLANVLDELALYDEAREHYERAIDQTTATLGPEHPNLARYYSNYGHALMRAGNDQAALQALRRSLQLWVDSGTLQHPDVAQVRMYIGQWHAAQSDHAAARAEFSAALELRQALFGPTHPLTAEAAEAMATEQAALLAEGTPQ